MLQRLNLYSMLIIVLLILMVRTNHCLRIIWKKIKKMIMLKEIMRN